MDKTELCEIKKGKIGTGLLIEQDGYISLSDNKQLTESSFNRQNEWHCPYPFIVHAVFQKYGIKNANGRIYPEEVLKKQIEIYQERVRERRALGECYSEDAMILTNDGWKNISEVNEGELVLTLNVETNEIEIKPIIRKVAYDYVGDMIRIKNRNINDLVTQEHQYPIYDRNNKFKGFFTANDILNGSFSDIRHSYIPKQINDSEIGKKYISSSKTKGITLDRRSLKVNKEFYKGKVYCIEVENHTWFVMQNKKCHWTGNCNHPSESTIDLGRVSHNIIELHWEGSTLVGQMELNLTKGFVDQGICSSYGDTVANLILNGYKIGVSSRGVGSVEQKLGQYIVGDDFELICFDVVCDPSTPLAYIGEEKEEIQRYVESKENKKSNIINEKINKINKILKS